MPWIEDTSKRGRKQRVEYNSDNPRQRRAILTIHDQHYHDGSAWQPVDESFVADGTVGKKCEKTRHIIKVGNAGARTWYPRREVPTEYLAITQIQYWRVSGGGSWRTLTMPTPAWTSQVATWDMTNLTATITNTWRQSKAEFILKNSSAYTRLRFAYTLVGLAWDGWALRSIADGTIVGWLTPPVAWDATVPMGAVPNVPVTATNAGGYIEYSVDTAGKTFPILVDPTFTTSTTGLDADTCLRNTDDNFVSWMLWVDRAASTGAENWVSIFKQDLSSLADVTLDSGYLQLTTIEWGLDTGGTYGLHRIASANSEWTEAGATGYHQVGTTNWAGGHSWCTTSGTDWDADSLGSLAKGAGRTQFPGNIQIPLDMAELALLVANNYGMFLHFDSTGAAQAYQDFCGSEDTTAASRPVLVIEYTEGGSTALTVADLAHAHTMDNVVLTQHNILAVADLTHAHTTDTPSLAQNYGDLTVADLTHAHTIDAVVLTQHNILAVGDLTHAHTLEEPTLTEHAAEALTVGDLTHAHTMDNVVLTQHNVLVVQDLTHAHTLDELWLGGNVALVVADLTHAHTIDSPILAQNYGYLTVANLTHAHTLDAVALTQHNILVVANLTHAHTIDSFALIIAGTKALTLMSRDYTLTLHGRPLKLASSGAYWVIGTGKVGTDAVHGSGALGLYDLTLHTRDLTLTVD